jgi:hypothetical protein
MSDAFSIDWAAVGAAQDGQRIGATSKGDAEYDVTFYLGKLPNHDNTNYTEVEHIRLQAPGSSTVYDQPASDADKARFPLAYAAFKSGRSRVGGTPLTDWNEDISESDVRRLELAGVRSVEQLARVADGHLGGLGFGGRLLRDKARAYVMGQSSTDPEKAELKGKVDKLTEILGALMEKTGITLNDLIPADEAEDIEEGGEPSTKRGRQRQAAEA